MRLERFEKDLLFSRISNSNETRLTRIDTQGTTPHRLRRPKEGSIMTQPTIQRIPEDHDVHLKA
jgi:hypothetical protein